MCVGVNWLPVSTINRAHPIGYCFVKSIYLERLPDSVYIPSGHSCHITSSWILLCQIHISWKATRFSLHSQWMLPPPWEVLSTIRIPMCKSWDEGIMAMAKDYFSSNFNWQIVHCIFSTVAVTQYGLTVSCHCTISHSDTVHNKQQIYHNILVDGLNKTTSSWMRYVNCARWEYEQNLVGFRIYGIFMLNAGKKCTFWQWLLLLYSPLWQIHIWSLLDVTASSVREPLFLLHCHSSV